MPDQLVICVLEGPVRPEHFFDGIHYSHGTYNKPMKGAFDGTPNVKSAGRSDDDIVQAEERFGRALPGGLITLYKVQNGGQANRLCIPKAGASGPASYDDVILPFSGYNDLYPLETIRTVHDAVTDYANPDDPREAGSFPEGCQNMLILAQWYRETLFLDYNQPGPPRVGFTDFDTHNAGGWQAVCVWWKDFETFFAALRHYEEVD